MVTKFKKATLLEFQYLMERDVKSICNLKLMDYNGKKVQSVLDTLKGAKEVGALFTIEVSSDGDVQIGFGEKGLTTVKTIVRYEGNFTNSGNINFVRILNIA